MYKYTPLSVFQRLLHPHKSHKYTAIDCTIVTLTKIGVEFETSALDSTPLHPLLQNSGENTGDACMYH